MSDWLDLLTSTAGHPSSITWQTALLSCLVAFVLSHFIAWIYDWTFQGLSWSRGFVHSLVLGAVVSCLLMLAIGDNLARGLGIVGSLAIIRFRTNLRDPRDMVFVFAALGLGVAAGVQSYSTAIIGALVFSAAALYLRVTPFGTRRTHDGLLRFQIDSGSDNLALVSRVLKKHAKHHVLVTMRDVSQGRKIDCSYQVRLKRSEDPEPLLLDLQAVEGVYGLTFLSQKATVEV